MSIAQFACGQGAIAQGRESAPPPKTPPKRIAMARADAALVPEAR